MGNTTSKQDFQSRLQRAQCIVARAPPGDDFRVGARVRLKPVKYWFAPSAHDASEHVAVECVMWSTDTPRPRRSNCKVVVKFYHPVGNLAAVHWHNAEDINAMRRNFTAMEQFLQARAAEFPDIAVNRWFILDVQSVGDGPAVPGEQLWVEAYIPSYGKSIDLSRPLSAQSHIILPVHPRLQALQRAQIRTPGAGIIVDIQGSVVGDTIVLSDIEFHDTLLKFNYQPAAVVAKLCAAYGIRRATAVTVWIEAHKWLVGPGLIGGTLAWLVSGTFWRLTVLVLTSALAWKMRLDEATARIPAT